MPDAHEEFLALLQPAYDGLARYARALTGNAELAEDLVSDTVLIALQVSASFAIAAASCLT